MTKLSLYLGIKVGKRLQVSTESLHFGKFYQKYKHSLIPLTIKDKFKVAKSCVLTEKSSMACYNYKVVKSYYSVECTIEV